MRDLSTLFFDLPSFSEMLVCGLQRGALQEQVANKCRSGSNPACSSDISRDAPYFWFLKFQNAPGKYFYVWLTRQSATWALQEPVRQAWRHRSASRNTGRKDSTAELYHFIGKDIVYFHSLFWPAMLEGSNFRKPTNLFVHGYDG